MNKKNRLIFLRFNFQTTEEIDKMRERFNASGPQCPVGLTTQRFPGQFSEVTLAIRLLSIFTTLLKYAKTTNI